MKIILFALPGNETLTRSLAAMLQAEQGEAIIRHFPDGESYVRIISDVKHKKVILICTLNQPDIKLLPLYFMAGTARELGATHVTLVAPYLAYMRQDKAFHNGEAITSRRFADLISGTFDSLITIDPHLHRFHHMHELYAIPSSVLHAASTLAEWVKAHIPLPLLIGPDEESYQWVSEVAGMAAAPFLVLQKTRLGDSEVKVSSPEIRNYPNHTPVLVDDIISTARTMIETVKQLQFITPKPPVCIGVHAVFAAGAFDALKEAGAAQIITCNTIPHPSNSIKLDKLLAGAIAGTAGSKE
ncbi:ribose-phosphate pyrophosphokinase [Pontibacter sp. MBLB2868]|uniref:ribose-phosphate pyrophosphokinase n=1 Tax=Pontibacter sp. MBLB2868 TaxID=3451555 RepID=UPI003F74B525